MILVYTFIVMICSIAMGMLIPSIRTKRGAVMFFVWWVGMFAMGQISKAPPTNSTPAPTPIYIVVTATPEGGKQ